MIIFCIVIIITVVHSMYPPVREKHILLTSRNNINAHSTYYVGERNSITGCIKSGRTGEVPLGTSAVKLIRLLFSYSEHKRSRSRGRRDC